MNERQLNKESLVLMKSYFLVAGMALVSSIALAGAEAGPPLGGVPSAAGIFRKFCADEDALFKAKIAFTEAKLDLQPRQRPSWDAFVSESSAAAQSIRSLCEETPTTADSDVAAELDFHQRALAAFLDTNRAFTTAAKKFLTALNSEQQRTLAELVIHPFPPLGPPGPHL